MVFYSADMRALLKAQKKSYVNGAACGLVGTAVHCLVSGTAPRPLVVGQVLIALLYLVMGGLLGRGGFSSERAGILGSCLGVLSAVLFVQYSGGPYSPYIQIFGAFPFMMALFTPGTLKPTLVSGLVTLLTLTLVSAVANVSPRLIGLQAFGSAVLLVLALVGSRVYQRVVDSQHEAHQARLRALQELAESERLRGRAERERAEVERLVLMGQLAAGVAHEVNNPLAFVKANLSYLAREAEARPSHMEPDELKGLLEETLLGVLRIQQIITDLKDFSRAGHLGEQERGALEEALREAGRLASVRLGAGFQVGMELEPQLPAVRLGQRHIVQVMVNLLLNAADAVEQARPPRSPHITVRARRAGQGVHLLVEDNGPGIPADVLPRLFEPFFTTKPPGKGTGLGLALCREYVGRAGGTLHAENRDEGGARFVLHLPLAEEFQPGESPP
jgi:two-component system, NtrC family, sensor kinase